MMAPIVPYGTWVAVCTTPEITDDAEQTLLMASHFVAMARSRDRHMERSSPQGTIGSHYVPTPSRARGCGDSAGDAHAGCQRLPLRSVHVSGSTKWVFLTCEIFHIYSLRSQLAG